MNNNDETESQIEAYALGALDVAELGILEQQLAASPERYEELRQLREVVALLPYAATPRTPPDRVREQLFARISAGMPASSPLLAKASSPTNSGRPNTWLIPALFMLMLATIVGLGGLTFGLQRRVDQLDENLAQARAGQAELVGQLDVSRQQLAQISALLDREQYVVSYVSAPGVATRQLNAVDAKASARGQMYMYPGKESAVVLFSGLPVLDPGQVYQFWLADGSSQIAGGTFVVDEQGMATLVVDAPREVNAFRQVMLTIEPRGGSQAPSKDVILEGSL